MTRHTPKFIVAAGLAAAMVFTAPAMVSAGNGSGKANFQDLSFTIAASGDDAPRPIPVHYSKEALDKACAECDAEGLAKMIATRVQKELGVKELKIDRKKLAEIIANGGGEIAALSGGPKFKIEIKIVIKF